MAPRWVPPAAAGIFVQPTGSGSAIASIVRAEVQNNRFGIQANTSTTTGTVTMGVMNSTASGSSNSGIAAVSAGQIFSYNANQIDGNTNNSTPLTGVGLN